MKLIKRITGDILGIITIPLCVLFQPTHASITALLLDMFMIVALPILFLLFCLKTILKILFIWKDFKNPLGKYFMIFSVISSIAAFILQTVIPDTLAQWYETLPNFVITGMLDMAHVVENVSETAGAKSSALLAGGSDFLTVFASVGMIIGALVIILLTLGPSLIPFALYIWIALLIGMIWAAVSELRYGLHSAYVETFNDWKDFTLGTLLTEISMSVRLYLYFIPVVNVIWYRYLMAQDKQMYRYPPVDARGRIDKDKLHQCSNLIYSHIVK